MGEASRASVLVVDHCENACSDVATGLMNEGYRVAAAHSMEEALFQGKKNAFDLVVTDVVLPGMGGIGGIKVLKKEFPKVSVIATSGGTNRTTAGELLAQARKVGADNVLPKPVNIRILNKMIDTELMRRDLWDGSARVLVIDDSRTVRKFLVQTLDDDGFEVLQAGSMEEALDSADIVGVDVVVTDIFMPGKGGIAGIAEIRANWPQVKIIAISGGGGGLDGGEVLSAAKKIGADMALRKPFDSRTLIRAVKAQLH